MDSHIGNSLFQAGNVQISPGVQNLEEEEEIEDQKRRQEEIQSLLTKAMDEFNYDDQSTLNSSASVSVDYGNTKYKEAPIENQLELLYNVRVQEVETLSRQLKTLEQQIADVKSQSGLKLLQAEAELNNLHVSLKNAQELIVEKCSQFEKVDEEKKTVLSDMAELRKYLINVEQENGTLKYTNQNLMEQVAILENGRGANPLSEAMVQEQHHLEVSKLQDHLENAVSKIQRIEKENLLLAEKLNTVIAEKEDLIANKSEVINKLMHNIEEAQEQNHELIGNVNRIATENERLLKYIKELENNVQVMKGFTDKTEIIKMLQKELEKAKSLNAKYMIEFDQLRKQYVDLTKAMKTKDVQIQLLEENITNLGTKPTTENNLMQTSKLLESFSVSEKLRDTIDEKEFKIKSLEENLQVLEDDITNLNKKLELSSKRDSLTIELQEKALKLEQIILNNTKPLMEQKSTNTDFVVEEQTGNYDMYKVQFESEMIEREIQLRKQLQNDFERNYEMLKQKHNCLQCAQLLEQIEHKDAELQSMKTQRDACDLCYEMSTKLSKNIEMINQQETQLQLFRVNQEKDRELIVKILEEWQTRFKDLELENRVLKERLDGAIQSYTSVQTELVLMKKSETQLVESVKSKAQTAIRNWKKDTLQQVFLHNNKIAQTKQRIDSISRETDNHIKEIERNFSKTQLDLKLKDGKPLS